MPRPALPPPITSFRDAIGFAMELTEHHISAHAAVLLAADGRPVDIGLAEGGDGSLEAVTTWAIGAPRWAARPRRVLLVSLRAFETDVIREADLRLYRRAGWSLAAAGADLVDWIETDGDVVRSYAYLTCPASAWPQDPAGHRRADGGLP